MTDDNHGPQYDKRMKSVGRKVDLLDRIAELEAEVEHWREARKRALDGGEILKAENEKLRTQLAEARAALVKCADPQRWHAPCVSCGPKLVEAGCYIARATLAKLGGGQDG